MPDDGLPLHRWVRVLLPARHWTSDARGFFFATVRRADLALMSPYRAVVRRAEVYPPPLLRASPDLLRKPPALRYQHASKRDELVFLRIIEARVQGLGRFDDLLQICLALRETIRLRRVAIHRRQVTALLLLQGDHARLLGGLDCGFKRAPILFLVSGQPKTGLHALELGVDTRLRPMLHLLGVRGLLIALCGGGDGETGSGEGGCGGRGSKHPKDSAFHDDASDVWRPSLFGSGPNGQLPETDRSPLAA